MDTNGAEEVLRMTAILLTAIRTRMRKTERKNCP